MRNNKSKGNLKYVPLSGNGSSIIQKAEKNNLRLMSYKELINGILNVSFSEDEISELLSFNRKYYDTGDMIINNIDGECLILLNNESSKDLLKLNSDLEIIVKKPIDETPKILKITKNGWFLGKTKEEALDRYETLKKKDNVLVVPKEEIESSGRYKTQEEVLNSEVLRFLAQDDKLHKEYVKYVFSKLKEENVELRAMPIFLDRCSFGIPEIGFIRFMRPIPFRAYVIRGGDANNKRYLFFGESKNK